MGIMKSPLIYMESKTYPDDFSILSFSKVVMQTIIACITAIIILQIKRFFTLLHIFSHSECINPCLVYQIDGDLGSHRYYYRLIPYLFLE